MIFLLTISSWRVLSLLIFDFTLFATIYVMKSVLIWENSKEKNVNDDIMQKNSNKYKMKFQSINSDRM